MTESAAAGKPLQQVFKVRRDYNTWVANETIEDYALRFTPRVYRKWPTWLVANTAFSSASFLVLEAIGATLLVEDGFVNALWAILIAGAIILAVSVPISRYSARYGLDMDLLTRGSGFGYMGSTITSLIYAAFTFIFFALEASIMATGLQLATGIPLAMGYLLCALVVIPLVLRGVTMISRLQSLTQPVWLLLLLLPYLYLLMHPPAELAGVLSYGGFGHRASGFDWPRFSAGLTVVMSIIAQMGEQADYLRFMPEPDATTRKRWLTSVMMGGSGWLVLSVAKMMGGTLLAYMVLRIYLAPELATSPNEMYLLAYQRVFGHTGLAIGMTALFVLVSQIKINVTNAYAGSLAWSNFFSRLTHSHPGRAVWLIFNTLIALMLMELGLQQAMGRVLGLYSNVATAWIMTVVADLVINKRMGWSPPGVEFRRAYLHDINPVGIGAMTLTCLISVMVYLGVFGQAVQPDAIFLSIGLPLLLSPLIARATHGRYYVARQPEDDVSGKTGVHACCICGSGFESSDMAYCPAYQGHICSLCCTLDARCHDMCKPDHGFARQWLRLVPDRFRSYLEAGLGYFLLLMTGFIVLLLALMGLLYYQESLALAGEDLILHHLQGVFLRISAALLLVSGVVTWWMALAWKSRQVAQAEANYQTQLLVQEIESHSRTDEELQRAKRNADLANQAKSRYVMSISHELRTPLNTILGYAQILDGDQSIPPGRRQAIHVIRRSGEHLLSLIESALDLARIESGKVSLNIKTFDFADFVQQLVSMFELQARNRGIGFECHPQGEWPVLVRADAGRLRQILINILGNAVKYTQRGRVVFHVRFQSELATFEVEDTGPGMSREELERIFEPFARGSAAQGNVTGGTGLGLTIARMLTDLMGGELTAESVTGQGSRFRVRLFLPQQVTGAVDAGDGEKSPLRYLGYTGLRRRILLVDDERADRELLVSILQPLGFELAQAENGQQCLDMLDAFLPDLIIMDLNMPVLGGWATLQRIKAEARAFPVMILSANVFETQTGGAEHGVEPACFLTKPVNVEALLSSIGQLLELAWQVLDFGDDLPHDAADADQPVTDLVGPPVEELVALREQIDLGYVRGIQRELERLATVDASYTAFAGRMLLWARQYRFADMKAWLDELAAGVQSSR